MHQKYKVYVNGFGTYRVKNMNTGKWYKTLGPFGVEIIAEYSSERKAKEEAAILSKRNYWVPVEEEKNG